MISRREFVQGAAAAERRGAASAPRPPTPTAKTRSYNENMEYRRLGRTNLMLSAVSMGGHWKQIPFKPGSEEFKKNRREVICAALDHGINYIDACWSGEVMVYAEALGNAARRSTSASTGRWRRDPKSPARWRR